MMPGQKTLWLTLALLAFAGPATAELQNEIVGGDTLLLGGNAMAPITAPRDVVAAGPTVTISGTLIYSAPTRIDIPATVVSVGRTTFTTLDQRGMMRDAGEMWNDWECPVLPTFTSIRGGFIVTLGLFFVLGAIILSLMPKRVGGLEQLIAERPGMALLSGVVGF